MIRISVVCFCLLLLSTPLLCQPGACTADPGTCSCPEFTGNAAAAWTALEGGFSRFLGSGCAPNPPGCGPRRDKCARCCGLKGQTPFAVVLSFSDSRVPPEILFDQGLGDVFVVRVAGNVASDEAIGSIEYAIAHLGKIKLIVVLGHEDCGAVKAALSPKPAHDMIPSFLNRIYPAIDKSWVSEKPDLGTMVKAIKANAKYTANLLPRYSPIIKNGDPGHNIKAPEIRAAYYSFQEGTITVVPLTN
jgi:carbonic anhydrase